MKNTTMKKVIHALSTGLKITAVGAAGLALMGCPPEQEEQKPVEQSKTFSGIATEDGTVDVTVNYTALPGTTPGYLSLIEAALIDLFPYVPVMISNLTIDVIANNSGFTKTGSKTLSVGESWFTGKEKIDVIDAIEPIVDDWLSMNKNQNRIRYAGGMSPFELAKFQKYGNVRNS